VIAGPAGGWVEDLSGRALGLHDGRPTLLLEDLVVALRAFSPNGRKAGTVHCSIDPTQEGLQRMQDFLQKIGGRATPRDTQFIVNGLQQSLGKQVISVGGISPKTNFARVMVEADYRMKLIGIGLEQPPIKLTSYVARATPGSVSRNAMQRWYFVPNYEAVRESADGLAMELVGQGVKLVGENEVVGQDGSRNAAARGDRAGSLFVKEFTTKYPQLAERSPVYAHLRNLIDMLVAAAYIQDRGFFGKAGWSMETFGSEQSYPVEVHTAPKQVASAVNAIWKGNRLMTPIGGGVMIQASKALAPEHIMYDEEGEVEKLRDTISLDELPADKWWWD